MQTLALGAAGLAAAGGVVHGIYYRNSPLFGPVLARLPAGERSVALTFDDGPNPGATPRILETLRREGVPATFFVLGRHAERWPELVRQAVEDGHAVGNHGWAHRKLHRRGPAYVRHDLARGAAAIERACGVRPRLFRAPHGFRNPWVARAAARLGERTVGWSLGVWDSDRPGAEAIAERVLRGTRPGSIVLLHDGDGYDPDGDRMQTALALPLIIAGLRERGYVFRALPRSGA
ncbi:MAG TPA: polysaccharide deacetylase family protein [Gemmatimonadaceae bacterium]|nr:polysaccharide deacetylase family protein [Gemmatimonadaceae bacterium]